MRNSSIHFSLEDWQQGVKSVAHLSFSDSVEGILEGLFLNLSFLGWVLQGFVNNFQRSNCDLFKVAFQVLGFKVLDLLEHVEGSLMEVSFNVELFVGKIVNESSLLDEVVFALDSQVFDLLLGVSQVRGLFLLGNIRPHGSQLLSLVSGVNIVEYREFGTNEVSEVTDLSISKVEGDQEFMMPDHTSDPFVVRPSS